MENILIINAHHASDYTKGGLNAELTRRIGAWMEGRGKEVRLSVTGALDWDVEEELEKHQWTDCVVVQSPVNWMGVPWSFKKYMDEVYTAGMFGALCHRDGRSTEAPKEGYGTGGTMQGKRYMLSLTFNAPKEAFNDPDQYLFAGKSVDDLWFPMHMNFRFFAMEGLPTFVCYDVMKNPTIEEDFLRLEAHLEEVFCA